MVMLALALGTPAAFAQPTRSSPLTVAPDGHVFVVNPDSNTVARLEFDAMRQGLLTHETPVGTYPRTVAVAGPYVFTADQNSDTVSRRAQADLGDLRQVHLGFGCNPYGVAAIPGGGGVVVSCQGSSEAVLLDADLGVLARVKLPWPGARALAVSANGATAYVTHYLTIEPNHDARVSVVDVANKSVAGVLTIPADRGTCETQNSGQGVFNLLSAVALMPDGAPAEVANQLWVGGTQENTISKGLFKRHAGFKDQPGAGLFPWAEFAPFPAGGAVRNVYKSSFHDITRFGIYKVDLGSGNVVGKIDIDEANNATDIELSADGRAAHVVDLMFNSYHVFNTARGQNGNPTTLFSSVSSNGPGGADPAAPCISEALRSVTSEADYRMAPQAQITPIDGYDPVDPALNPVNTGVEFDAAAYHAGTPQMKLVPDAIGTAPTGVRLSPDGQTAYVANYLARNVVPVASAAPLDAAGRPANLRCAAQPTITCGRNNDCPAGTGFCNHPGGAACTTDADCGSAPPCIRSQDCVPLMLGQAVSTITGGIAADPLPPALLDGKILFNTAARDGSLSNNVGLGAAAPLFNNAALTAKVPGSVTSTSHDASYVTCSTCHADFGGQDGRTWDFSQFGASLRNTMDLRGRAGFSPGTCSNNPAQECFFDAGCGTGNTCKMNPQMIPPNIPAAERDRFFNPMLTVHWNGDRDEVEDFEHTYRSLLGAGDCDGIEFTPSCQGGLIQRSADTSTDPADVHPDLGSPNRNIRGPLTGMNVGIRLTNMADFVYSLTEFPKNPNPVTPAVDRGRRIFNDPATQCTTCHVGGPGAGRQFFTDKKPNSGFDPTRPAGPDFNNPFVRHDVGTLNLFDAVDPLAVAMENQTFQNPGNPPDARTIPASRGPLGDYVTPVLNDLWNTAPYLHDGSAHTLLDVIRPCDTAVDDCRQAGRGRNLRGVGAAGVEAHGATSFLTPQQLNDLVDFQNALTLGTLVGTNERVLNAGTMQMKKLVLTFPKQKKNGRTVGRGRVLATGTLAGAAGTLDPSAGVVVSLAVPAGERMAILESTLAARGRGRRFTGSAGGGTLSLALKPKRGSFAFTLKGKGLDLSTLDTGNRDVTVAIEIGKGGEFAAAQFVQNRVLTGKKNVFTLPKNRRRG